MLASLRKNEKLEKNKSRIHHTHKKKTKKTWAFNEAPFQHRRVLSRVKIKTNSYATTNKHTPRLASEQHRLPPRQRAHIVAFTQLPGGRYGRCTRHPHRIRRVQPRQPQRICAVVLEHVDQRALPWRQLHERVVVQQPPHVSIDGSDPHAGMRGRSCGNGSSRGARRLRVCEWCGRNPVAARLGRCFGGGGAGARAKQEGDGGLGSRNGLGTVGDDV